MKLSEKELIAQIQRNAEIHQELERQLKRAYQNKSQDPEAYKNATRAFHEQGEKLIFPGGGKELTRVLKALKAGDTSSLDLVITYLRANPYFFRSGYIKEELLQAIKKLPFTKKQIYKLQDTAINAISCVVLSREFTYWCRLAPFITDEEFYVKLQDIFERSDDAKIKKRAQRMLNALKQ